MVRKPEVKEVAVLLTSYCYSWTVASGERHLGSLVRHVKLLTTDYGLLMTTYLGALVRLIDDDVRYVAHSTAALLIQ